MWNFVFFILLWDVLRVVLGSSSRKPPNHLKNRANPWLKTAMAASQGMQDQISNAMSTIEDVLGNLRWGGHFLHPKKNSPTALVAVFFRWGGRGWGWNHRGFPTGEPSHGIKLPTNIPQGPTGEFNATWPGVCRSRNARAGRWTWKIRTTLRKSAKAFFPWKKKRLRPKPFPWKITPRNGTSGKRLFGGSFVFFLLKWEITGKPFWELLVAYCFLFSAIVIFLVLKQGQDNDVNRKRTIGKTMVASFRMMMNWKMVRSVNQHIYEIVVGVPAILCNFGKLKNRNLFSSWGHFNVHLSFPAGCFICKKLLFPSFKDVYAGDLFELYIFKFSESPLR